MWSIAWISELTNGLELHKRVTISMCTWRVCFGYCVEVTNACLLWFGGGWAHVRQALPRHKSPRWSGVRSHPPPPPPLIFDTRYCVCGFEGGIMGFVLYGLCWNSHVQCNSQGVHMTKQLLWSVHNTTYSSNSHLATWKCQKKPNVRIVVICSGLNANLPYARHSIYRMHYATPEK